MFRQQIGRFTRTTHIEPLVADVQRLDVPVSACSGQRRFSWRGLAWNISQRR